MKIVQFITSLDSGGAEKIACELASQNLNGCSQEILVLRNSGKYLDSISPKIKIKKLNFFRYLEYIFNRKSIVIHSHLYHSHLMSFLFFIAGIKVIWTIHTSFQTPSFLAKSLSLFSRFLPGKIIYVSNQIRDDYEFIGFKKEVGMTIPNGVEKASNYPNKLLSFVSSSINICMVCRYHPVKGYDRFFKIASALIRLDKNAVFWLIGKHNTYENLQLKADLYRYGLSNNVVLLGEVLKWREVLPRFDLLVSTSYSEAFGLTILEGLFSRINVSSIDLPVIDEILGEYSVNDKYHSDAELAKKWLDKAKTPVSNEVVSILEDKYSVDRMVEMYNKVYQELSFA